MSDLRDKRGGAYDPVNKRGNPQPPQVRAKQTPHQREQWGADVRAVPLPGPDEGYPLPEGLRKSEKDRSTEIREGGRRRSNQLRSARTHDDALLQSPEVVCTTLKRVIVVAAATLKAVGPTWFGTF
jgi:hypothetical protein